MSIFDYDVEHVLQYIVSRTKGGVDNDKLLCLLFLSRFDLNGYHVVEYLYGGKPVSRTKFVYYSTGFIDLPDVNIWILDPKTLFTYIVENPLRRIRVNRVPLQVQKRIDSVIEKYGVLPSYVLYSFIMNDILEVREITLNSRVNKVNITYEFFRRRGIPIIRFDLKTRRVEH